VTKVLADNEHRWEGLAEADRERLETMARSIVSRMLHEPTLRLKQASEDESSYVYVQTIRELFGLEDAELGAGGAEVSSLEEHRRTSAARSRSHSD
jgi:glutamyl-tRNA reductase